MGKLPKTVTDRVKMLEEQVSQVYTAVQAIQAALNHTQPEDKPVQVEDMQPVPQVGKIGVPIQDDAPDSPPMSTDQFLFVYCPQVLQKLVEADHETAIKVTDWLIDDSVSLYFFLLWFASNEDIRKYLMFTSVLRNINISASRFEMLRNTISPAGFAEVKKAYEDFLAQSQAKQAPVAAEEPQS